MERKPGRPIGSMVRQNIVEILNYHNPMHGYDIYKIYDDTFPKITLRSIYYHLKKGVSMKVFRIVAIEQKQGNYSWGGQTKNIFYELGPEARALGNERVKKYVKPVK